MRIICDLHLHSRYSLATSKSLNLHTLATAGKRVGIDLLAAPDFTHPEWRDEMRSELVESGARSGIFVAHGRSFLLISEVSCIWREGGKSRRVHLLITAPNFQVVSKMSEVLATLQNLASDGRPIFKISARQLFEIARKADPRCEVIPAHVFTPWYGVFGAKSGFDSLEECFGDAADEIFAVETGLSSDPSMHWSIPDSRVRSIVSFSDAHSVGSLGREATVLDVDEMSYDAVMKALRERNVVATYEFHPEHGKYHYDGHRKCGIRMDPAESAKTDGMCPICQRPMTFGVLNRGNALSDGVPVSAVKNAFGLWEDPSDRFAPYRHMVPLREILAYTLGVGKTTKRVNWMQTLLIDEIGSEFDVLLNASESDIVHACANESIADAVINARLDNVMVEPGYDGVYGSAVPAPRK